MATQSMLPKPEKSALAQPPKGRPLRGWVKRASRKGLEVLWRADSDVQVHELEVRYYYFGDLRLQKDNPIHRIIHEVTEAAGGGTFVPDPEGFCKQKGWAVIAILKGKSRDGNLSESVEIQTAWDDEQTEQASSEDLKQRSADFERKHLVPFLKAKGGLERLEILIIGGQHFGKSSCINHLDRCIRVELKRPDEMDPAPAGADEKTQAVKRLAVPVGDNEITFMDTPALSNMNEDNMLRLSAMLRKWFPDGTRRDDLNISWHDYLCSIGRRPPHAAIVVVSLCKWQNEQSETQEYLHRVAREFKTASLETVEFPYVVAATHRDEFLECIKNEDPMKALERAVSGIKSWASTEHVYPITNYKQDSMGSEKNNKETFDLLGQLVTKAKNQETSAKCFVHFKRLYEVSKRDQQSASSTKS